MPPKSAVIRGALTALRRDELEEMRRYVELPYGSHMDYLITALDGDSSPMKSQLLPQIPSSVDPALIQAAVAFLKRSNLPIPPRLQWPAGGLPIFDVKGNIDEAYRANVGISLSMWGDAGWGRLVKSDRYSAQYFGDELLEACAEMVEKWSPQPMPTWVTAIPSLRNPTLVPNFAERLAVRLGLPYSQAISKILNTQQQKFMANSSQQALNLDGALAVDSNLILTGPVLLVDDIVNSRWTFTVAAMLLRKNGSGEVWPLALAQSGNEE